MVVIILNYGVPPWFGEFSGLWKYRVGTFRLICEIRDGELIVLVIELGHRGEIYK